jgi:hypothetical protein
MMLGLSAQYHKTMHIWKDGVSTNYITTYEFDSITFSTEFTEFQLSHDFITLRAEQTLRLKPNMPVDKWESSNEAIATVNNGLITGIAEGYANITATSKGYAKTCVVQVLKKSFFTENGCYILGEASPIKDETDSNAMLAQMAQGINEQLMNYGSSWEEAKRDGLYEKYIYLEADKEFELVLKDGDSITYYGTQLSQEPLQTDMGEINCYQGKIVADKKMMVSESGLYHIIVDWNKDGILEQEKIIVVPVDWGISGSMNGWGMTTTYPNLQSAIEMSWSWENIEVDGVCNFKFKNARSGWKIYIDDRYYVNVHTNLGADGRNGGEDIVIEERGIYTIKLVYNLAAGDIENSYSYEIIKTEQLPEIDPSTFIYSFIGTVNGNWDTDTDFIFVSKNDNHYVFEANNLDFPVGEFKIRVNHDWGKNFGYYSLTVIGLEVSGGDNIITATPFKGTAKLEFDWNGWSEENVVLTFYPQ